MAKTIMAGMFARLRGDTRGNTLMLFAFSLLPLMGMVGGALDMSRAYLVKSRLQQACDAAVLGGRRSMSGSTFDTAARNAADSYFNLNFTPGRYGTTERSMDYNVGIDMIVHGTAAATLPTIVMKVFGTQRIALTATCEAQMQLPNSDIMFVLDTTLSMSETNPSDTQSRIAALRTAVTNFYTTLNNAQTGASQVRYGFVPYSSTVNVGLLLKREWMVDNWDYQSREQNEAVSKSGGTESATITTYTDYSPWSGSRTQSNSIGSSENCVRPDNENYSDIYVGGAWSPNAVDRPRSQNVVRTLNGNTYSATLSNNGVCTITKTAYADYSQSYKQTVTDNPNAGKPKPGTTDYFWNYKKINYPLTGLKGSLGTGLMAGGSFDTMIGNGFTKKTINWGNASQGACIEERGTLRPSEVGTAYDLDIDLKPDPARPETQWRPFLPDLVWSRSVGDYYPKAPAQITGWQANNVMRVTNNYITPASYKNDFAACPSPSRKLATIRTQAEKTALTTYLNALQPRGRTYHDIGMLWGLRLMSGEGIFKEENAASGNGGNITRNLIFMTDGDTETNIADYDAYGLAALDRRRTAANALPTNASQDTIVENRLTALCTLAKDRKNITVWVIAFGTTLTPLLSDCASPNRAYQANNSAQLAATFADIATRIAQLRVTR